MSSRLSEVVILNDFATSTGGSTGVALASARALAARGVRVTYFSCVGPVSPSLQRYPNLAVVCLGQLDIGRNPRRAQALVDGYRNARARRALRSLLARKSPATTLVHAHTWSQALSPFALAAAGDLGFRLVVTLHDFFTACPNGQFFDYPRQRICQRVPLSFGCWRCNCDRRNYGHKLWRNTRAWMQHRLLRTAAAPSYCIGVSRFSLNLLRPHLPAGVPTRVIHNPVDSDRGPPAPVARNTEFLFIGRFEPEKGVLLFARALQAAGVAAAFVGDGSLREALQAACPRSRFTGWLAPEAIRRQLRRARALVFPSLWYETLGLVVAEAAAAGVPAIVSDRCAATEIVTDGVNGLHFTHGSAESLSQQLAVMDRDRRLAERLGRASYDQYWRNPWTSERHVTELLDVYGEVMERGRPKTGGETSHESIDCIGTRN